MPHKEFRDLVRRLREAQRRFLERFDDPEPVERLEAEVDDELAEYEPEPTEES